MIKFLLALSVLAAVSVALADGPSCPAGTHWSNAAGMCVIEAP